MPYKVHKVVEQSGRATRHKQLSRCQRGIGGGFQGRASPRAGQRGETSRTSSYFIRRWEGQARTSRTYLYFILYTAGGGTTRTYLYFILYTAVGGTSRTYLYFILYTAGGGTSRTSRTRVSTATSSQYLHLECSNGSSRQYTQWRVAASSVCDVAGPIK